MQFSIITPSFRSSGWLRLCIPSVADQGVELEHIVQDSVSDDGTLEWLPHDQRVRAYIEKDRGMYDAVNRGFRKAKGEILAYINCDEQYLPGALPAVWDFFQRNPGVEIVFADTVVVNDDGSFNCCRKVQIPDPYHTMLYHLCTFTCATFVRRRVIEERGHFYNPEFRDLGDMEWVLSARAKKIPMRVFRHYTSAFTETGDNMNLRPNAMRERLIFRDRVPFLARKLSLLPLLKYRLKRLLLGGYSQKPFDYSIYTKTSPTQRVTFHVHKPRHYWDRPIPETTLAALK